jgi:DNA-binding CsgD family transcriptional regulator
VGFRNCVASAGLVGDRLDSLPVLVVLASRSGEPAHEPSILTQLASQPAVDRLVLRRLSESSCAAFVSQALLTECDPAFVRACHESTGGNPFYLRELVAAVRDDGIAPTADGAARVPELAPKSVGRSVLLRVGRLGGNAVALARAVAVLGPDAELRHAADLAGLDGETAELTADALATAEILAPARPLAFVHPIVHAAIAGELNAGERSIEHKRAARLLHAAGASPDRVALHLLRTEPQGDPCVVEHLRAAADWSVERAVPEAAVTFLRRALAEPPHAESRTEFLFELGRTEQRLGAEDALIHLAEAVDATDDVAARAACTIELASALHLAGRPVEAVAACDRALAALGRSERELALRLEAIRCRAAIQHPVTYPSVDEFAKRFRGELAGRTPGERGVLVQLALRAALLGTSAREVAETLELALGDDVLFGEHGGDSIAVFTAIIALTYADRLDEADELIAQALAEARRRGSLTDYIHVSAFGALVHLRRGEVAEAEADARGAVAAAGLEASAWVTPGTFALMVEALLERGEIATAVDEFDRAHFPDEPPQLFVYTMLLHSRALLRLTQGRVREALADALLCGSRQDAIGILNPSALAWRSTAALAHQANGDGEEASRLADEEVRLARSFGAPRALGMALRTAGLVAGGEAGLRFLEQAVDALATSPARLEHARALVDLGTALRHANQLAPARERLRTGLDLAHRCLAGALAERARAELLIAGARPRRDALHGRDALTASEVRVALMAAEGMTNREIAQALFVTTKTVETHLHHAFQKLDVDSRTQLGAALAAPSPRAAEERPALGRA